MPCLHAEFWAIVVCHSLQVLQPSTTDLLFSNNRNVFTQGFRFHKSKMNVPSELWLKGRFMFFPAFGAANNTCFPCPIGEPSLCIPLLYRAFSYVSVSVSSCGVLLSEHPCTNPSGHVRTLAIRPTLIECGLTSTWLYLQRSSFQITRTRVKTCAHIIKIIHVTTHKSLHTP